MVLEGFQEDEWGALLAEVGDIKVSIGVHRDCLSLAQEGDHKDPDLIVMSEREQIQALIDRLQTFLDSQ